MSRTLKFRVWHEMCHNFGYFKLEDGSHLHIHGEPEQFTGLLDRNGKEIYEGDIVKESIEAGDDDIDGEYRYQVVWDEKTLCWSLYPNYGTIHKDLWETNLSREIIGNIHESNMGSVARSGR